MALTAIRTMTGQMLERVVDLDNLRQAFKRVRSNKGAPGVDGMTVEELGVWLGAHVEELRSDLLSERYFPKGVRGKAIPKGGGGERLSGIPTVLDRYADDVNIYVHTQKAGERVMSSVTRFLEKRLRLRVNREKSAVDYGGSRKFLGYRILGGKGLGVHPKTLAASRTGCAG